jgi:uncharacterized phiE125 gp8 family phage protein
MINVGLNSDSVVMYKARAYTYLPINNPVTSLARTVRPIDIADIKPHAKIDFMDNEQETSLNLLIDAAINSAEKYTNRSFINQSWRTYRDFFTRFITLERGTNATVNSFKYLNTSNVLVDVDPTTYYVAVKDPYTQIVFNDDSAFPQDLISQQNSVVIEFTGGYGTTKESVSAMLRLLLIQHVTWLYENKGNCPVTRIPELVRGGYDEQFRVVDLNASTYL